MVLSALAYVWDIFYPKLHQKFAPVVAFIVKYAKKLCDWFEAFYKDRPNLLKLQCNVALLFTSFAFWCSKLCQAMGKWNYLAAVVSLAYYMAYFWSQCDVSGTPRREITPTMKASIQWALQAIMNYMSSKIEENSPYADWYASISFFLFYVHLISLAKMKKMGEEFGAGDGILAIGVSMASHLIGGVFAKVIIPVASAVIVFVKNAMEKAAENDAMEKAAENDAMEKPDARPLLLEQLEEPNPRDARIDIPTGTYRRLIPRATATSNSHATTPHFPKDE